MFERIDRDVEQAISDYNEALTEEDKAQVKNVTLNSKFFMLNRFRVI